MYTFRDRVVVNRSEGISEIDQVRMLPPFGRPNKLLLLAGQLL